ncbi:MAG: LEA type 2 family protein [Bacteroidales bacterium]|nr:MAG: LEA type 2 family protein [Bacteroidales bacterium]
MKSVYRIIAILFISSLFHCCSEFQEIRVDSPTSVKFNGMRDQKLNMDLFLPITNPNNMGFKITRVDLEVIINDSYIGNITGVNNVVIQANSRELYQFNLDLEIKKITSGIISLVRIFGNGQINVESNGTIRIRSGLIFKTIPVKDKTSLEVRIKIPGFGLNRDN